MVAILHRSFLDEVICPPTEDEKEEAKRWVEEHSCDAWRDGYCMVDGTLIILFERPFWYGESYFDWKSNSSLNFQVRLLFLSVSVSNYSLEQIISLPNLRIIDIGYGYTGSTHDATAWQKTQFYQRRERYLWGNEFIWADSAYPVRLFEFPA